MKKIELYSKGNPELTVALPMYNSKQISMLAFESLLNQNHINFDWELIIYEEQHDNMTDWQIIEQYANKLKENRCTRFVYITQNDKAKLIDKWIYIANKASYLSKVYLLQAADCYSYQTRLHNSYKTITKGYHWYDNTKGLFYSFNSAKLIEYNANMRTNLSMALPTKLMQDIPTKDINKGIDGYIFSQAQRLSEPFYVFNDENMYLSGLDTHGLNNISIKRESYFDKPRLPFKETNTTLEQTYLPTNIKDEISRIEKRLRNSV